VLEKYIEHNIFRKVYLCEQLYEFSKIDIEQSAKLLKVSIPTLQSDLENMIECLEYCIESYSKEKHYFMINFKDGITLSELTQFIYGQSYVLKFISYYFKGIFSSTTLSDLEFISLSKVYKVKKIVLDFFKENEYLNDKKILIPEFDSRNILLALVRYINWDGYDNRSPSVKRAISNLIEYVEINFFNRRYSDEEKFFIYRGIEIAVGRKEYSLKFSDEEKKEAENKPLFILVSQGLSKQKKFLDLQEDDVYYIFSLFNTRNYTNKNMELLRKDVDVVYKHFVTKNIFYQNLFELIAARINVHKCDNYIFKRAFIQFVRTLWANGQVFLPEKIYLLNEREEKIYSTILSILDEWKENNNLNIRWNYNLVRKFIKEIELFFSCCSETSVSEIFIVTENATKQLFYRDQLSVYMKETVRINSGIYHSLKELPNECFYENARIVLCDMKIYHNEKSTKKTIIFPVSLRNIETQLYLLKKYLNENKKVLDLKDFI
jgi:hypothetical protein